MARSILIRKALTTDLDRILDVEHRSFEVDAFSRHTLQTYLEKCSEHFYVAEMSDDFAGYMISTIQSMAGLIVSIAVDPKYRNQGIGSALVKHSLKNLSALGIEEAVLRVRSTNIPGIHFWKKMGFAKNKTFQNFYADNASALNMVKVLSSKCG